MMPERSFLSATAETPSRLSISSWLSARPPWPAAAGVAAPGPPPLRSSLRSASAHEAASESSGALAGFAARASSSSSAIPTIAAHSAATASWSGPGVPFGCVIGPLSGRLLDQDLFEQDVADAARLDRDVDPGQHLLLQPLHTGRALDVVHGERAQEHLEAVEHARRERLHGRRGLVVLDLDRDPQPQVAGAAGLGLEVDQHVGQLDEGEIG